MKKILIAGLIAMSGISQAKEINLNCSEKELTYGISFNTATSKGIVGDSPVSMNASESEYVLFRFEQGLDREYKINRENLSLTIVYKWKGLAASTNTNTGKCSISTPKNNLI